MHGTLAGVHRRTIEQFLSASFNALLQHNISYESYIFAILLFSLCKLGELTKLRLLVRVC